MAAMENNRTNYSIELNENMTHNSDVTCKNDTKNLWPNPI